MDGLGVGWLPWHVVGLGAVGIAERNALGTTARIAVWPASALCAAVGAADRQIDRLDRAASRFRPDSDICLVHAQHGEPVEVSADLAEAIDVALAAARWSGGLVDPTIGAALIALGYDDDFVEVQRRNDHDPPRPAPPHVGWQSVLLDGRRVQLPAAVQLDLGATAKGLGADWVASAALAVSGASGVVVSLGGDVVVAGESPSHGWPVLIADDHLQGAAGSQVVRLSRGGLATSSITCRQWRRGGQALHHIIDPRTRLPATGPWRTVSALAATCADANAASTAAIICGDPAPDWLADHGVPARLVGRDGRVVLVGGWPAGDDRQLPPPPQRWLELANERQPRK
jgi:thiamine biosynthesis lipoprotein